MVNSDRKKRQAYIDREVATGIINFQKTHGASRVAPGGDVSLTSDDDEPTKPSRAGRVKKASDLAAQNEQFLNIYQEKNVKKEEFRQEISSTLGALVENTKKKLNIVIIGKDKVNIIVTFYFDTRW